jgi:hypothetical protein
MGLFKKKDPEVPVIRNKSGEPVLRCSICTGEQVLCLRDRETGKLTEIMMIHSPDELERVCRANSIDPAAITKVY